MIYDRLEYKVTASTAADDSAVQIKSLTHNESQGGKMARTHNGNMALLHYVYTL